MIDEIKLAKCATQVLTEHVGVAAEFIVDDALRQLRAAATYRTMLDSVALRSFVTMLGGLVPSNVRFESVTQEIVRRYKNPSPL